eukprot:gene11011-13025_t
MSPAPSYSVRYDPSPAWPLCGRLKEAYPDWVDADGCPSSRFGSSKYSDEPINSPFGPRQLYSESLRYDFHRGIDLSCVTGTPLFAIADGTVQKAGVDSSYSDPLVQLRHHREEGCYHSNYLHLSAANVSVGDSVVKGQLVGYSGASGSGYEHLHFELRDSPPEDPYSAWQRDCVNPVGTLLPYSTTEIVTVDFVSVNMTTDASLAVKVNISTTRMDINRVEITVNDAQNITEQPGNTPDAAGYHVYPSFVDFDLWNAEYTHKDSTSGDFT